MTHRCHFIPPYLLHRVASADVDAETARCGHATLAIDEALRARRQTPPPVVGEEEHAFVVAEEDAWTVHSADHGSDLPGRPVRSAGEPPSGDVAVDEAYSGIEASVALFAEEFRRDSYDGRGAPVIATVHYERNYDNAFWDGRQLVFGDGDGRVFDRFTKPVDVLAHEFAHAVTQYTSGFAYQGESGALNESMSDVFAACVKQRVLGQIAEEADWLVGEGIFMPSIRGVALRSMADPGTAYDDPVVGTDPQVGHMADYVRTRADNGGVHINSGIPNRAFHIVAVRLGGRSWERAGQIWYLTLAEGGLGPDTDFATFARATVEAAEALSAQEVVAAAWAEVGIPVPARTTGEAAPGRAPDAGPAPSGEPEPAPPSGEPAPAADQPGVPASAERVSVTRSGGFAGLTVTRELSTAEPDCPRAAELRELLDRVDLDGIRAAAGSAPQPDRYVYTFCVEGCEELTVAEQDLTPDLARLAAVVLDE